MKFNLLLQVVQVKADGSLTVEECEVLVKSVQEQLKIKIEELRAANPKLEFILKD